MAIDNREREELVKIVKEMGDLAGQQRQKARELLAFLDDVPGQDATREDKDRITEWLGEIQ